MVTDECRALSRAVGIAALLLFLSLALACGASAPLRVLVLSKSAGYEHPLVYRDTAWPSPLEEELLKLGEQNQLEFTFSKDGSFVTAENLDRFDAVLFYTSGDLTDQPRSGLGDNYRLMTKAGKEALLQAIENGKGFIGVHSAVTTFAGAPESGAPLDPYTTMLGAKYRGHPSVEQPGHLVTLDPRFPGMQNVPAEFSTVDEWYSVEPVAPDLHVILALDGARLTNGVGSESRLPIAWARMQGKGRVFVTDMGHSEASWQSRMFRDMLLGGIRWAAGAVDADIAANLASRPPQSRPNLTLPANDSHLKRVQAYIEPTPFPGYEHASPAAMDAFRDLKFGVRIHWGLYSMIGDASWPLLNMSNEQRQTYQESYKKFNPTRFDAEAWMKLFETNGVKMLAFTTKHHDGFSMFDTKTRVKSRVNWTAPGGPRLEPCDLAYSVMETPYHRDIVKEICDAAHRHGIKIDLYFSHPDWFDADFRPYAMNPVRMKSAEDFGALRDELDPKYTKNILTAPEPTPEETERMIARHRTQLTELLTRYGPIDMVCLDQWLGPKVWPDLRETIKQLRQLQPNVMFRARGIGNYGDYYTPENWIPGSKENTDMPWMVIYRLAGTWVYQPDVEKYHDPAWVIQNLADIAAKGGNLMIGIGPNDAGEFHPRVVQTLQTVGAWLRINGPAIYATRPRDGDLWKEGETVRFTRSKDRRVVYAICLKWPGATLNLKTVRARPGSAIHLLGYDRPLSWQQDPARGLVIQIPAALQAEASRPNQFPSAFQIEGEDVTPNN